MKNGTFYVKDKPYYIYITPYQYGYEVGNDIVDVELFNVNYTEEAEGKITVTMAICL